MDFVKTCVLILFVVFFSNCRAQPMIVSFENVSVIPMGMDTVLANQRVVVSDGRILRIEPASKRASDTITTRIQADGKYLIPGLVETHYHLQNDVENEFKLLIANGITSARNMAEYPGQDHIMIRSLAEDNKILSPHYYTTGPYLKRDDLANSDSVRSVIAVHKQKGYDYLKLADDLPEDIYLELLALAHAEKIEVVGHGQRELPLEFSLRIKSIAHVEEFMNIFTNEQKNSTAYLEKAAREIKTSGVYVSPTLGIFEMIIRYASTSKSELLNASDPVKYLPKHYSDYWKSNKIGYRAKKWFTDEESLVRLNKELEWQKMFTEILSNEGVPLMAGSDTYGLFVPGFSLHHELELLNRSGLSTYETLKTATVTPARYLNAFSQSGTISVGKLADLVLLANNPLDDIRNTKAIVGVMVKGRWLNREKLDELLLEVEHSNN